MQNPQESFFKGGVVLSAGAAVGAACTFARNVVVARFLTVEDFGIALTFAITMTFVEMMSNMATDRYLIQSAKGDEKGVQSSCQTFEFLRGAAGAVLIFTFASYIAKIFDLEELTWAYQVIAVVPLLRGFVHLDSVRFQRQLKYTPSVVLEVTPQLVGLLSVPVFAVYMQNYQLMLGVISTQISTHLILSHILAERKYRWGFDKLNLQSILKFGWPLTINSLLLFGVFQLDRVLVGYFFSVEDLGWFGAAFAFTLLPSLIIAKVIQSFMLPRLALVQDSVTKFRTLSEICIGVSVILACTMSVGLIVGGEAIFVGLYGEKYAPAAHLVILMAVMQGIRVIKVGPVVVAIASGQTKIPLKGNFLRLASLVFGIYAIIHGFGPEALVLSGIFGEVLAVCYMYYIISVRNELSTVKLVLRCAPVVTMVGACFVVVWFFVYDFGMYVEIVLGVVGALACISIGMISLRNVSEWVLSKGDLSKVKYE